mmetsp:Transcript_63076/g.137113  ORF Transcript_63076/g.137113 Transcript_63076/m.137113 type:complete len:258 (-) Transcript_63076:76-849(-)
MPRHSLEKDTGATSKSQELEEGWANGGMSECDNSGTDRRRVKDGPRNRFVRTLCGDEGALSASAARGFTQVDGVFGGRGGGGDGRRVGGRARQSGSVVQGDGGARRRGHRAEEAQRRNGEQVGVFPVESSNQPFASQRQHPAHLLPRCRCGRLRAMQRTDTGGREDLCSQSLAGGVGRCGGGAGGTTSAHQSVDGGHLARCGRQRCRPRPPPPQGSVGDEFGDGAPHGVQCAETVGARSSQGGRSRHVRPCVRARVR